VTDICPRSHKENEVGEAGFSGNPKTEWPSGLAQIQADIKSLPDDASLEKADRVIEKHLPV
jgi:hypothetical protein